MTVDAAHAGHLVTHALGLQHVADADPVEPSLMTMAEAVRGQTSAQGSHDASAIGSAGAIPVPAHAAQSIL